jgi:hypothetical protein
VRKHHHTHTHEAGIHLTPQFLSLIFPPVIVYYGDDPPPQDLYIAISNFEIQIAGAKKLLKHVYSCAKGLLNG